MKIRVTHGSRFTFESGVIHGLFKMSLSLYSLFCPLFDKIILIVSTTSLSFLSTIFCRIH